MKRRLRSAVELVSDIGSKAFELQHHSDRDIAEAVKVLRSVNGPMFKWLVEALERPSDRGLRSHRHNCQSAGADGGAVRPQDASPEGRADDSTKGAA